MNVLEVIDKTGRTIGLPTDHWKHILAEHPGVSLTDIEEVLKQPLLIRPSDTDETVRKYYRFDKARRRYLRALVKYLNGRGFIITAYRTCNIT